jgi:hypothetical protein
MLVLCAPRKIWQGENISVTYTKFPPKEDFEAGGYMVVAYDILSVDKYSKIVYRFEMYMSNKQMGALELCDRNVVRAFIESQHECEYFLLAGDSRNEPKGFYSRQVHKMYEEIPGYLELKNDVIDVLESE